MALTATEKVLALKKAVKSGDVKKVVKTVNTPVGNSSSSSKSEFINPRPVLAGDRKNA